MYVSIVISHTRGRLVDVEPIVANHRAAKRPDAVEEDLAVGRAEHARFEGLLDVGLEPRDHGLAGM